MMDDQMDGEQPPSVFYPPASAFGLFASAPYSVVGYPPDAQPDPVARKRERDIFPLVSTDLPASVSGYPLLLLLTPDPIMKS